MPKEKKMIDLHPKVKALLDRKGYFPTFMLAEGSFGQVFMCIKKDKETREEKKCAVKVMDMLKCGDLFKFKFIPRELAAIMTVHHKNIIGIYDIFEANKKIYIFMEFAGNGTIADVVIKKGPLTESKARDWFKQTLEALHFMHTVKGIAHRDIKPENILLDSEMVPKISDFGFAKEVTDGVLSQTYCGTAPFYAPEILMARPYEPFGADVWAMGVFLFWILNSKYPFHFNDKKIHIQEMKDANWKKRFNSDPSDDLRDLLKGFFQVDVHRRITTKEAIRHPWMSAGRR